MRTPTVFLYVQQHKEANTAETNHTALVFVPCAFINIRPIDWHQSVTPYQHGCHCQAQYHDHSFIYVASCVLSVQAKFRKLPSFWSKVVQPGTRIVDRIEKLCKRFCACFHWSSSVAVFEISHEKVSTLTLRANVHVACFLSWRWVCYKIYSHDISVQMAYELVCGSILTLLFFFFFLTWELITQKAYAYTTHALWRKSCCNVREVLIFRAETIAHFWVLISRFLISQLQPCALFWLGGIAFLGLFTRRSVSESGAYNLCSL